MAASRRHRGLTRDALNLALDAVAATIDRHVVDDGLLAATAHESAHRFGIHHATIEVEAGSRACHLAPDHVV